MARALPHLEHLELHRTNLDAGGGSSSGAAAAGPGGGGCGAAVEVLAAHMTQLRCAEGRACAGFKAMGSSPRLCALPYPSGLPAKLAF